jgi:DNA-binding transcriptional LysR family regulator
LHGHHMVGFDGDLTIRREIDRVLNAHDAEVIVQMEFDNIETIKRAVEINTGVSLLPEPTVKRERDAGTLVCVPLDTDELVRPLGIIMRRGKELSVTAQHFIEHLQRASQADGTNRAEGATFASSHEATNGYHGEPAAAGPARTT